MNQQTLIFLTIFLAVTALGYLSAEAFRTRFAPHLRRWLQPMLERAFPILRLEPWLFEAIAADDLPQRQRQYFEIHTPGYIARGFTHLGDYVLRRDPAPSCVRLLLSRDRTTIGSINCYLGEQAIECISVLLDGQYLESANVHTPQLPPAEHGLMFCCVRTNDVGELIEQHGAFVKQASATRASRPAPLEPGDVQAAMNYGRQLALRSLHQQGVLNELPAFLSGRA